MSQKTDESDKPHASEIPVAIFRQIHHWPLIQKNREVHPDLSLWIGGKCAPLDLMIDKGDQQDEARQDKIALQKKVAIEEFNYFHDFIQRFLYTDGPDAAFDLYERKDITGMSVVLDGGGKKPNEAHHFKVERLTLHMFKTGAVMVTLETVWTGCDRTKTLSLAQAQTLIDHTRRSYAPFWAGNSAQRCPRTVTLTYEDQRKETHSTAASPSDIYDRVRDNSRDDAEIFGHWRKIAGLRLNGGDKPCEWRDPSDERIPVMSFIALEQQGTARDTMLGVRRSDWLRIADAEEAGDEMPYNTGFSEKYEARARYDRFFPDAGQPSYMAARHLFGGAHYNVTCVTDPKYGDDFSRETLQYHFRNHYAQMGMMIRFEYASLLAFSSRITDAVCELKQTDGACKGFERRVRRIHEDFLLFVNRFRFTGVTSQDQGAEMFQKWRDSLRMDELFRDVGTELQSTADYVRAEQDTRRAEAADTLNIIAFVFVWLGLLLALIATPLWERIVKRMALECEAPPCDWQTMLAMERPLVFLVWLFSGAVLLVALKLVRCFRNPEK